MSPDLNKRLIDNLLRYLALIWKFGLTENAGHENDGPSKLQDMKLQDMKLTDQISRA